MNNLFFLDPLDVIASNDPRALEDGGYAQPGELHPQVVAGALATQILEAAHYFSDRYSSRAKDAAKSVGVPGVEGTPSFRLKGTGWWHPETKKVYLPVPRNFMRRTDQLVTRERYRLFPNQQDSYLADGGLSENGISIVSHPERSLEYDSGFITLTSLCTLLGDFSTRRIFPDLKPSSEFYRWERRHGHKRTHSGLVEDGMLYSRPVMRPISHVDEYTGRAHSAKLVVFLDGDDQITSEQNGLLLSLGADGHQARIRFDSVPDCYTPIDNLKNIVLRGLKEEMGVLLYIASPTPFVDGWRPKTPEGMTLKGATVDRPLTLSGWDIAQWKPKPILSAAPAGSVYFFSVQDSEKAAHFVEAYHFNKSLCIREDSSGIDYTPYGRHGYGLALTGLWDPSMAMPSTGA